MWSHSTLSHPQSAVHAERSVVVRGMASMQRSSYFTAPDRLQLPRPFVMTKLDTELFEEYDVPVVAGAVPIVWKAIVPAAAKTIPMPKTRPEA